MRNLSRMRALTALVLALAAMIALPAGAGAQPLRKNWNVTIVATPEGGHLLGNPDAPMRLVEYLSYSCPHCAVFDREGMPVLRADYVATGKLAIEMRPIFLFPTDPAVSLIANCAAPLHFLGLHGALYLKQQEWYGRTAHLSRAQTDRWTNGDAASRLRAMASDMGLYEIAAAHGVDRAMADHCLSSRAAAEKLAQETATLRADPAFEGTPSFVLNGVLLAGTHDWKSLEFQLKARM